jgi:hypothetical protein
MSGRDTSGSHSRSMIPKLLLAFALLFSITPTPAQSGNETPPPLLDAPDHWQIHDGNGPMDLEIHAEFVCSDGFTDFYYLSITGTLGGQPYSSWAIAQDSTGGQTLDVYNGDSELWTQWEWKGDHYDKVGGTANRRSYYPVYE